MLEVVCERLGTVLEDYYIDRSCEIVCNSTFSSLYWGYTFSLLNLNSSSMSLHVTPHWWSRGFKSRLFGGLHESFTISPGNGQWNCPVSLWPPKPPHVLVQYSFRLWDKFFSWWTMTIFHQFWQQIIVCLSHSWTVSIWFDLRSWFLHHMVAQWF